MQMRMQMRMRMKNENENVIYTSSIYWGDSLKTINRKKLRFIAFELAAQYILLV